MGLDMYLTRLPDADLIGPIAEEVMYWRKANAIHAWFVDNVQGGQDDCSHYPVTPDQLSALLALVEQVLEDHTLAPDLLPTKQGFFFGSEEYDENYFMDLEKTKAKLHELLDEAADSQAGGFYYHSSW